jgi:signal transduction histidine kinase
MADVFHLRPVSAPTETHNIAHELNNLLTAIAGYSQLVLVEDGVPEHILQDVGEIADASTRAVELVRRLQSV